MEENKKYKEKEKKEIEKKERKRIIKFRKTN